jgi:hypothetical protein
VPDIDSWWRTYVAWKGLGGKSCGRRGPPLRRATALLIATTVFGALAPNLVQVKVPGRNGQIVFARLKPALDDTASFTVDPDGTDE